MKKSIILTAAFVFMLASAFAGSSYACSSCPAHATKAPSCGPKTDGTSAKASCGPKMDDTSTKKCGADCTKTCCVTEKGILGSAVKTDAMFATATFSINGMTCSGCESQVSKKLSEQTGVTEVIQISHKNNSAELKYNPNKIDPSKLAEMVTKMGYKAEVVSTVMNANEKDKTKTM